MKFSIIILAILLCSCENTVEHITFNESAYRAWAGGSDNSEQPDIDLEIEGEEGRNGGIRTVVHYAEKITVTVDKPELVKQSSVIWYINDNCVKSRVKKINIYTSRIKSRKIKIKVTYKREDSGKEETLEHTFIKRFIVGGY